MLVPTVNGIPHIANGYAMISPEIFREEGYIESYAGPMRGKKSSRMFDRIDDMERAGIEVLLCKPDLDTRTPSSKIMARDRPLRDCVDLETAHPESIFEHLAKRPNVRAIGLDEAELFGYSKHKRRYLDNHMSIIQVLDVLRELRYHVVTAFLNQDFAGRPFGPAGDIMAISDYTAICSGNCMYEHNGNKCGKKGTRTQRLVLTDAVEDELLQYCYTEEGRLYKPASFFDPVIIIEELDTNKFKYQLRCDDHHFVLEKPNMYRRKFEQLKITCSPYNLQQSA
jgi:thymidine kinase